MAGRTIGRVLDWDDLRLFLAVARNGSFSAAARALRVSQPTVGRRIARFEQRLGAKLFAATPSGQLLSSTGKRVLARAERMEAEALAAESEAAGRDAGVAGPVRVTASEWLVDRVLGPMAAPLLARHPRLLLDLVADPRHLSLVRRDADIAVRPSRFEHQEVVESEVAALAFGIYASDKYLAERGVPDFARGCEGHSLIAMSESLTRVPDVDWLPRVAGAARPVVRANARLPMASLAAAGVGLACLPRFVGDATPGLRLLATPGPAPVRPLYLACHRSGRSIPRVRATMAFLREGFARLRPALHP